MAGRELHIHRPWRGLGCPRPPWHLTEEMYLWPGAPGFATRLNARSPDSSEDLDWGVEGKTSSVIVDVSEALTMKAIPGNASSPS